MKQYVVLLLVAAVPFVSCIKEPILINGVAGEKARIDAAENPALKYEIRKQLGNRKIQLFDVTVKNVVDSNNIDYDFCVIADVQSNKGTVECYIYSTDVKTIARLVDGKSKVDVSGDFGRFFNLLDDYYTSLDIVDASIVIK
jgi:hypothetical protein